MFQGNNEFQVYEVEGSKKVLTCLVNFDFNTVLFTEGVEDSHSLDAVASFSVSNGSFEGLDLKLFGACGGYFNVIVFVEKEGDVVVGTSLHFFPPVYFQNLIFFGIEVNSINEELFKIFIFGEDEEVDAQDSINLGLEVFKIDIGEISYFELDACWDVNLTVFSLEFHYAETILEGCCGCLFGDGFLNLFNHFNIISI